MATTMVAMATATAPATATATATAMAMATQLPRLWQRQQRPWRQQRQHGQLVLILGGGHWKPPYLSYFGALLDMSSP